MAEFEPAYLGSGGGGGDELTAHEEATVQALAGGTYFYYNQPVSGAVNGVNVTHTLPHTPNPAGSLHLLRNGQSISPGGVDFTLSGDTITMVVPLQDGESLLAKSYTVAP